MFLMSTAPTTQDEYIASLPVGSRNVAERMRAVIHQCAPEAVGTIKYGMPAFLISGAAFLYFAVWKKHVGIYPIYAAGDELEAKIAPYRHGKDTVRFLLSSQIDYQLVAILAQFKRDQALATGSNKRGAQ
jgi:uncharacterized protein YdhG (YjbR/CyaY superfamily)